MPQHAWVFFHDFFTYHLRLQMIRNMPQHDQWFFNSACITYILYVQITLVLVLNQLFLIVQASLSFCMHKMPQHLNQRLIAEYSKLIFVLFLCVQNCPRTPQQTSLNKQDLLIHLLLKMFFGSWNNRLFQTVL